MGYLNTQLEKKALFSIPAAIGGIVSYKKQKEGDSTDKLISALGQGLATGAGAIGGGLAGGAVAYGPLAKAIGRIKNKKLATALELLIGGGGYVGGGVLGHKTLDWLGYND